MSRIGNSPIVVPEGVNVEINSNELVVSGKLGSLSQIFDGVSVSKEDNIITVSRNSESKDHKSKHGFTDLYSQIWLLVLMKDLQKSLN